MPAPFRPPLGRARLLSLRLMLVALPACSSQTSPTVDLGPAPAATCMLPVAQPATTSPTVVGTGTAASCTAVALSAAVAQGGSITFDCGGATTISVTSEIMLATNHDTILDGGGMITLDGGGQARILHFAGKDYRGMYGGPEPTVTVENLTFTHGKAAGTAITVPAGSPAACSRGIGTDGGGGAILVESGVLHVFNSTFVDNHAAELGPDVAGGAIYAIGSTDLTIVGSRFSGNSASNGGSVGCLNSDLHLVNDTFDGSSATGNGANSNDASKCPATVNKAQIGSGGNGGAVSIDGGSDGTMTMCGCSFTNNTSGALGGAMFRTPDGATQLMQIDRTTFDGNRAPVSGGGVLFLINSKLELSNSTLSNNSAVLGGAMQTDNVDFTLTNVTVAGNTATDSNGGAFFIGGSNRAAAGSFTNVTVANNQAQNTVKYQSFGGATFGGTVAWNNCLIVNNTDNDSNGHQACDTTGTGSNSLEWPTGSTPPCAANITMADPQLGTLADNGGTTLTMVPGAAASVVQIGTNCPATDQTGHTRSTPCTAGAYEAR